MYSVYTMAYCSTRLEMYMQSVKRLQITYNYSYCGTRHPKLCIYARINLHNIFQTTITVKYLLPYTLLFITPQDIQSKVNRALVAAQKDNDFIYHERVPNIADCGAIGRAPVAKPTPVATEVEGWSDVFGKLVPLNVQQAATMYASRKDHLIHIEVTRLRDATNSLNR